MKTFATIQQQSVFSQQVHDAGAASGWVFRGKITLARVYFIYNCQSKRVHTSTSFTIKNDVFARTTNQRIIYKPAKPDRRSDFRWEGVEDCAEYCASVRRTSNVSDEKFGTAVFLVRTHMLACVFICSSYLAHVYPQKYKLHQIEVAFIEFVCGSDTPHVCMCIAIRYIYG